MADFEPKPLPPKRRGRFWRKLWRAIKVIILSVLMLALGAFAFCAFSQLVGNGVISGAAADIYVKITEIVAKVVGFFIK